MQVIALILQHEDTHILQDAFPWSNTVDEEQPAVIEKILQLEPLEVSIGRTVIDR